jgi:hypothetical protein
MAVAAAALNRGSRPGCFLRRYRFQRRMNFTIAVEPFDSADAQRLYLRAGYRKVDCWGEYLTAPTSVCYEKKI